MKVLVIHVQDGNTLKLAADLLKVMGCDVEEIEAPPVEYAPICIACGAPEGALRQQLGGGLRTVKLVVGQPIHGQQICSRCLEDARGRAREYRSRKEPKIVAHSSCFGCDHYRQQGEERKDECGSCNNFDHWWAFRESQNAYVQLLRSVKP
jgi:hypothetical protein